MLRGFSGKGMHTGRKKRSNKKTRHADVTGLEMSKRVNCHQRDRSEISIPPCLGWSASAE